MQTDNCSVSALQFLTLPAPTDADAAVPPVFAACIERMTYEDTAEMR